LSLPVEVELANGGRTVIDTDLVGRESYRLGDYETGILFPAGYLPANGELGPVGRGAIQDGNRDSRILYLEPSQPPPAQP
jgi:hypothetical protein